VPPEMQGRMFTLLVSAISVVAPLGLAVGGPLADAMGVEMIFVLSGAGCLLMALIWALNPTIIYLEDERSARSSVVEAPAATDPPID
jgi:DHA3 family macrolide efflux protein-like MFS transporter